MNIQQHRQMFFTLRIIFVICIFFINSFIVNAQGSAGVGIIPAVIDPSEQLKPGDFRSFSVKITNLSNADQTFYLNKRDIIGVKDGGVPIFADNDSDLTGYELSSWITLSDDTVFIPANGSLDITFVVNVPEDVSPGSHFGSIIVSVDPPKIRTSGASIGYEVANIINIRIAGDAKESARIRQFSTSKFIYGATNVDFKVRIENEGNTLVKPMGPLEINNMFGKRVAMLQFNETKAGIFPKTKSSPDGTREFEINWTDQSPGFGRYEALLSVVYGDEGKISTISSTVSFWILPMNIITPALIVFGLLFLIVFVSVKLYVRKTMSIAISGSNRRLVRSRQRNRFPTLLVIVSMLAVAALFFIVLLLMFA